MTTRNPRLEDEPSYKVGELGNTVEGLLDIIDAHCLSWTLTLTEQASVTVARQTITRIFPDSRHAVPTKNPRNTQTAGRTL